MAQLWAHMPAGQRGNRARCVVYWDGVVEVTSSLWWSDASTTCPVFHGHASACVQHAQVEMERGNKSEVEIELVEEAGLPYADMLSCRHPLMPTVSVTACIKG